MRAASLIWIICPPKTGFLVKYELTSVIPMGGKGKGHPTTSMKAWAVDGLGGHLTPRPLSLREKPGTNCIGGWVGPRAGLESEENVASTGIRSPDRPARSKSLLLFSR